MELALFGIIKKKQKLKNQLKEGDLVRVVKNPENSYINITGEVGLIQEILDDYASIDCFKSNGEGSGSGSVSLSCLTLETRPEWIAAKELYKRRIEKLFQESRAFSDIVNDGIAKIAKKYNVTPAIAKAIHKEIESLYPNY